MTIKLVAISVASLFFVSFTSHEKALVYLPNTNTVQATGKEIFLLNCSSCHHPTRDLTGPSLYGVRNRWKDKNLLYKYVRNPMEVTKKDPYANALYNRWKSVMTAFPKLKNAEIDAIFDYVDGEAKKKGLL